MEKIVITAGTVDILFINGEIRVISTDFQQIFFVKIKPKAFSA